MAKIKIGIIGVGNCASSLVQGIYYYSEKKEESIGLIHRLVGGYDISDIEVVLAIDIDARKVGKDISEAIFSDPNCTTMFYRDVPFCGVEVIRGVDLDGISEHTLSYPEKMRVIRHDGEEPTSGEVINAIRTSKAEMLVNYLPVGSNVATEFYAQCAIDAHVGFINCMPMFIASDNKWIEKFRQGGVPCIGDDIKSQLGATIVHRELVRLFEERGIELTHTYQINTGGNTDFLNMLNRNRLQYKKISKTEAVQSNLSERFSSENIHVGPSDYVEWQKDNKICFIRIEGKQFGGIPMNLELRLSVEDSPNSAGVVIDVIRCMKLALDRGMSGDIQAPSTYYMKHPRIQCEDFKAREDLDTFINQNYK